MFIVERQPLSSGFLRRSQSLEVRTERTLLRYRVLPKPGPSWRVPRLSRCSPKVGSCGFLSESFLLRLGELELSRSIHQRSNRQCLQPLFSWKPSIARTRPQDRATRKEILVSFPISCPNRTEYAAPRLFECYAHAFPSSPSLSPRRLSSLTSRSV